MADDIEDQGASTFDAAHYRQVLGHFATGVTVVAGMESGEPVGFTAQSFTALSLDPPLVAVCVARTSSSWPRIAASGAFCVNVLRADQEDVCRVFATKGADKFSQVPWKAGATGSPCLAGTLAWVDCTLEQELDGGDHVIAVGRVVDMGVADEGTPLLFYRGGFGRFEP